MATVLVEPPDQVENEAHAADTLGDTPYPGPESYRSEDAGFFYGRDREAAYLTARILSARMTVLYASSGAGKTSLLNASVIPGLEAKYWIPIYVRPNDNPIESVRIATLKYLLPPLDAEVAAVTRAMRALSLDEGTPLSVLLEQYDDRPVKERRHLIMPVSTAVVTTAGALPAFGSVTPHFCRLLRRSVDVTRFAAHVSAVGQDSGLDATVEDDTSLGALMDLLSHPGLHAAYKDLLSDLYVPVPGLRPFFDNLAATYGARVPNFGLVLIMDQFEELFTLFVEPGDGNTDASEVRDWRLRPQLFKELESIYCTSAAHAEAEGVVDLPIRFVISLREEYVAHLDPLRLFAPEVTETAYRLGLLQADDARTAIRQPAQHLDHVYPDLLVTDVVAALASDDGRLVEPSRLQIVCDKLWKTRGETSTAGAAPELGESTQVKDWVKQVLASFFRESLDQIADESARSPLARGADLVEATRNARMELLDILSLLITPQRTRNIVERRTLVRAPFRDPGWRGDLLGRLARRRIVRGERRLRGTFHEVAHEFLIEGILAAIDDELKGNEAFARLHIALDALVGIERGGSPVLRPIEFRALDLNRNRLVLRPWVTAVMMRSAIAYNDPATIREWSRRYARDPIASGDNLWTQVAGERLLTIDELRSLYAERETLQSRADYEASLERLVRSALGAALPEDRDLVYHWTYELSHAKT